MISIVTTIAAEFIGALVESESGYNTLKKPLRVQVIQGADGRMGGAFTPVSMFGELSEITLHDSIILNVTEAPRKAIEEYTRITSGIILP